MHQFKYAAPSSIEELLNVLEDQRNRVMLMAGGTDLIVQMRTGVVTPELVIDVKQVPELNSLLLSDKGLKIGAAVSCRTVCGNSRVASTYPALIDSASLISVKGRILEPRAVEANLEREHAEKPDSSLIIAAHPEAETESLVTILDAAKAVGIEAVSVATTVK